MAILTKDLILAAEDVKLEHVLVPEWGGEVLMRTMSGLERALFEDAILVEKAGKKEVDKGLFFAELLARTIVGEDGQLLFSTKEEVSQLMGKNGAVLMRLGTIATRINGLSAQDQEQLTKNSDPALNGVSPSASH